MRPFQIQRAHAGEHGVLHRAAEVGLLHQRAWICERRRTWRQVPSSIHTVSTDSATTIQNSVLLISPIEVRWPGRAGTCRCRWRERHVVHDGRACARGPGSGGDGAGQHLVVASSTEIAWRRTSGGIWWRISASMPRLDTSVPAKARCVQHRHIAAGTPGVPIGGRKARIHRLARRQAVMKAQANSARARRQVGSQCRRRRTGRRAEQRPTAWRERGAGCPIQSPGPLRVITGEGGRPRNSVG